ncbi:MAG: sucrose synthase, partial [Acidimicrobiales bacterium]|nr:sucrose synthase [Acidimicrobiales bacterium]
ILDQVRALEQDMRARLEAQGLFIDPQIVVLTRLIPESEGTSCDQRIEPISGTRHARILRVPFRDEKGEVVPQWISRFEIWPYLEQYALDAETELQAELGGRPDLIVGNYSDGNLVASLMAHRMQVTQCTIAHALEKSKYAGSDLRWREQDEHYHFSCQFTADLIAMNTTDFIITSSYQEIAGTQDSLGQYESYSFFTMPGLYRVVHGVDVYDPKFNIVAPGADPDVYFPHSAAQSRLTHLHDEIRALVYGDGCGSEVHGSFADESKPLLFTMARMDKIKNITGLAEWYGRCAELRDEANLLIVSGYPSAERSKDAEERAEIAHMHELFRKYELDGSARWIEGQVNKVRNGELYRFVADTGGAFVQPALFEAFGLTVVEAMSSGLPVFATCYGGPLEIIEDGRSGFHVDPNHGDEAAARMAAFFAECRERPERWTQVSEGALARIEAKYTWKGYAERMMTLARIYGFWHHATEPERREARRYLEMFYALQFRPLARAIGS